MALLTVTLADFWEGSAALANAGLRVTDEDVGYSRAEFIGTEAEFVAAIAALEEMWEITSGTDRRSITAALKRLRAQL